MPAVMEFFNDIVTKLPDSIKTFVYGGHPTVLPERTLEETSADYVIIGEGYETILLLLKGLINNECVDQIEGIAYRKEDLLGNLTCVINPMPKMIDVNDLPMINWDKLEPMLAEIEEVAKNIETDKIYKLLSQLVPQFNPKSNGFDMDLRDNTDIK